VLTEANIAKRKKQLPIYFSITLYFSDWFVLTSFYLFGLTLVSSFFYLPFLDLGQFHFSSQHFQIFGGGKNIYGEYVVCLTCILPHVVIETLHYYIGLLFFSFSVFLLYCWCSILGLAWWFPLFFFAVVVWFGPIYCLVVQFFHLLFTQLPPPPFISLQCLLTSRSLISLYPESHLLKESYLFSISVPFSRFSRRSVLCLLSL
jgi:hypothetical protein